MEGEVTPKKAPMQRVLQKLTENPRDRALRVDRDDLIGAIEQYLALKTEHEQLKAWATRIRFGPVLLNNLMKIVGGGFA